MQISRRSFVASCGSAVAAMSFARPAIGAATPSASLTPMLDRMAIEELRLMPEIACFFALDKGKDAALRSRVTDRSSAGRLAHKALITAQLAELNAVPRTGLNRSDFINLEVAIFTREVRAASQVFDFGAHESLLENTPYILTHQGGAFQLHSFSEPSPPIQNRDDADMDIERLIASAKQIDDESERLRLDADKGILLPDFLFDRLLKAYDSAKSTGAAFAEQAGFAKRLSAAKLGDGHLAKMISVYDEKVAPAIERQAELALSLRPKALGGAGYWQLPEGEAFYAQALHYYTTASLSAAEVHAFGREQARDLTSRMDTLLAEIGLTKGSVGERMKALAARPDQKFSNDLEGREALLAYARERVEASRLALPKAFRPQKAFPFDVVDLPPQLQTGGGGASATGPAPDGSRRGSVNLDLSNTLAYPKFSLPSLLYHEGYPGHQHELGVTLTNDLPLLRRTTIFSGFGEGWGLYAEQLADEIGLYDDDPLGRLGYLQGQLFRANRCVVDTGLHAMQWKRNDAAQYLAAAGGDSAARVEKEIDRYCAMGGQACAYKVGQARFVSLRARARARLGSTFDIRDFHDDVLAAGHLPLDTLEKMIAT